MAIVLLNKTKDRPAKREISIQMILRNSSMRVELSGKDSTYGMRIIVKGDAARIPSTTNSRLNMFPKIGLRNLINTLISKAKTRSLNFPTLLASLQQLSAKLDSLRVVVTINPEHQIRLEALKRLFEPFKPKLAAIIPLASKENRWLVTLHLPKSLHIVDSHNLCKPVCDWLEDVGVVSNDRYVDCYPTRNADYGLWNEEELVIALKPLKAVEKECRQLIASMLA